MRRSVPLSVLLMPLLPLLALAQPREAAALTTACVNTPALLQSALTTAQSNNTDNYIKVVTGSYGLSATVNISIPASYALTVEGGYAAGCASAPTATAYSTTIAGGSDVYLKIIAADGVLTLRNLTLSGFQPSAGITPITLYQGGYGGTLHVENMDVTGNTADSSVDVLYAGSMGGLIFDDNIVHDNANARSAVQIFGNTPALPFVVANNTVVNIVYNVGPGVWIDDTASNYNQVVGNVIEFNGGLAIDLAAQGPTANAGGESSGPNDLLHKPVLTSALEVGGTPCR